MGEIAEMMLDGTMCSGCGEWLHDGEDGPGFPGQCAACSRQARRDVTPPRSNKKDKSKTVQCTGCKKWFATAAARDQHSNDKHGPTS